LRSGGSETPSSGCTELEAQHERVIPVPSPGDKLLDDGRAVIRDEAGEDKA
jgi:hypothetical protein